KVAKKETKLGADVFKKCLAVGASIDTTFPGDCSDAVDFDQCVIDRVDCRVCLMLQAVDRLSQDCDDFDDDTANDSCPSEVTAHTGEVGFLRHPIIKGLSGDNVIHAIRHVYGGSYDGSFGQITPTTGKTTVAPLVCANQKICSDGTACNVDADCGAGTCQECTGAKVSDVTGPSSGKYVVWYPDDAGYTLQARYSDSDPWEDAIIDDGYASFSVLTDIVAYAGAYHTFVVFPAGSGNLRIRLH
ncbi:MAG: hypothetical protein VCB80_00780, partial [Deltaproteobacteria bacterium]